MAGCTLPAAAAAKAAFALSGKALTLEKSCSRLSISISLSVRCSAGFLVQGDNARPVTNASVRRNHDRGCRLAHILHRPKIAGAQLEAAARVGVSDKFLSIIRLFPNSKGTVLSDVQPHPVRLAQYEEGAGPKPKARARENHRGKRVMD